MNQWPQRIPPDLYDRITRAMGIRGCHPNGVWAEVREWLTLRVPVPDRLPDDPATRGRDGLVGHFTAPIMHRSCGDTFALSGTLINSISICF